MKKKHLKVEIDIYFDKCKYSYEISCNGEKMYGSVNSIFFTGGTVESKKIRIVNHVGDSIFKLKDDLFETTNSPATPEQRKERV
ncbi:MAG: hypothetical protein ACFFG0_03685 [Candidatus Thorarchaeota archaeon]